MKSFISVILPFVLGSVAAATGAAAANSTSMVGMGPHGFDWLIGSWTCTNTMPSRLGGPSSSTFTAARSAVPGSLMVHGSGAAFDFNSYVAYVSKTKSWTSPTAYANGDTEFESTRQTGKTITWQGTYFDSSSGSTSAVRDMYTMLSMTKQADVTQVRSGGAWKTVARTTCSKS